MVITICGSLKKYKLMCNVASKIMSSMKDMIVFLPELYNSILFNGKIDYDIIDKIELKNLEKAHRLKIDMSDIVLIIDYGAGQSTYEELHYAEKHNKDIIRLSEIIKYFKDDPAIMKEIKGH